MDSPGELIGDWGPRPIVVGSVEGIEKGPSLTAGRDPIPYTHVVMRVRVSETLRAGEPGQIHDGRVYDRFWQGAMDGNEETGWRPEISIEKWREAIPKGTNVMVFLMDLRRDQGTRVVHAGRGVPDGAELMIPHPQGLIFEYDGAIVDFDEPGEDAGYSWEADTIEEISKNVREYLSQHRRQEPEMQEFLEQRSKSPGYSPQ